MIGSYKVFTYVCRVRGFDLFVAEARDPEGVVIAVAERWSEGGARAAVEAKMAHLVRGELRIEERVA